MTPERRRRVEELYRAALTCGEGDRALFLASACDGDETLRRDVESLLTGRHLGAYRMHECIGAGGMGEVYRARDTALERDVAIKILPRPFTSDPERLARFEREARILASLNHPHIGAIYGLEHVDGARALVLELVDGETLAERIARGPMPPKDALRIARQIADGLAAAHDKGIVHRDLKPSNVKVTPAGVVKVLDFGLAKAVSGDATPDLTHAPTMAGGETQAGVIVGTPAYMSPEQARGLAVDERTDIWAFGCVLYEMLTGRAAFARGTLPDTLAAIVEREPDWSRLPADTPPRVRLLIGRCLEKDAGSRLRDAREAELELSDDGERRDTTRSVARGRQWPLLALAALATVLVLAGLSGGWFERWVGGTGSAPIRSLAVLPFENLSGSPSQEYFVDGMTEALITELARLGGVKVISRASVMRYKGGTRSVPEIARELGVDGIVLGGAVSAENRVAVTAQLVRANSDQNVWAERYERDLRDVVRLQSEIARTIGRRIEAVLAPEAEARLRDTRPVNPDAYQLTLQGRYFANQLSRDALERAVRYFEEATKADPEYAPAYAGLAFAHGSLSSVYLPPREAMPRAREAAIRAIALDPSLAEGHAWLGFVALFFDYDWATARRELERALELNPSSVDARIIFSNYLTGVGRVEEAIAEIRRAQELDPRSIFTYSNFGSQWTLFMARRYEESLEDGRRALELDPNYSFAHSSMGLAHVQLGDFERGIAALREGVRLENTPMLKAFLAYGYAAAGRRDEAVTLIEEVAEISRGHYTCAYEIAVAYAALDIPGEAFSWLEKAVDDRADCVPYMNVDPRLDRLRPDPRFRQLLARVGLGR